ncbi:MAG: hypothetical protein IPG73_13740 [Ignavibacteria bacterium]|nr:hypothetical protein [Ignavibacteria bacterium]
MPPPTHISAPSFLQWAYSDHLSNANRGVLAEYIVGLAVGATEKARVEWDRYDLVMPGGVSIEVKSSAYLQSWNNPKPSTIVFDIGPKTWWDAATNTYATERERSAKVYVFCVFEELDRQKADPLDLSQWFFLVCATSLLNEWFGEQKSVRLGVLKMKNLKRLRFEEIASAVEEVVTP